MSTRLAPPPPSQSHHPEGQDRRPAHQRQPFLGTLWRLGQAALYAPGCARPPQARGEFASIRKSPAGHSGLPLPALVGATLPRTLWITEIDLHLGIDRQSSVLGQFHPSIPGYRPAQCRWPPSRPCWGSLPRKRHYPSGIWLC